MMNKKIITAFKSVPNCLLLANQLKSWPFYFQDPRIDSLNWKPYSVCFKYWEYAWDCVNAQPKGSCQISYFLNDYIFIPFLQALLYGSCVSQKDNITKHACDKEFQALKACIRQAVSFLGDWSGSLFFLCLISLDIMLDFKPQTSVIMTR